MSFPTPGLTVNTDVRKEVLGRLLQGWAAGRPITITFRNLVTPLLTGQRLPPIEWVIVFGPLNPQVTLEEFAHQADLLGTEEVAHVALDCEKILHRFPRWDRASKAKQGAEE